jgi:hypothetical protein
MDDCTFRGKSGINSATVVYSYDNEKRLSRHENAGVVSTYTYSGDGLKLSENIVGAVTTIVWDGSDYLQARS